MKNHPQLQPLVSVIIPTYNSATTLETKDFFRIVLKIGRTTPKTTLKITPKTTPKTEDDLRYSGLNEKQIKAVQYVKEKGRITNREYRKLNSTTKRTATRDLSGMVQKGVVNGTWKGRRELKYVLAAGHIVPKMTQKMSQKTHNDNTGDGFNE